MDAERAPTFNAQSKNIFTRQCNASGDGQDLGQKHGTPLFKHGGAGEPARAQHHGNQPA
jgi:hypothetical protein